MSSQRGESYHSVVRQITNGQLSFEESGMRLVITVLSLLKNLSIFKYDLMRSYDRRVQGHFLAFRNLVCTITNFIFKKIEAECRSMSIWNLEASGNLYLSILYIFINKIDAQLLPIIVVSSYFDGAFPVSIIFDVFTEPGNLYRAFSFILAIGCKARPFLIQTGSQDMKMRRHRRIPRPPG
jgi:hypothetical protein